MDEFSISYFHFSSCNRSNSIINIIVTITFTITTTTNTIDMLIQKNDRNER